MYFSPPSLSEMARNATAQVLWTTTRMKVHLKTIFINGNGTDVFKNVDDFLLKQKFYTEAYQQLEDMFLPHAIKQQLRTSIRVQGYDLFTLLRDISRMISDIGDNTIPSMENFIENICFTNSGTVDVSATFRKIYRPESQEVDYYMWILASELCLEEYIMQWSPKSQDREKGGKMLEIVKIISENDRLQEHLFLAGSHTWMTGDNFIGSYYIYFLVYWQLWKFRDPTWVNWNFYILPYSETDVRDEWLIFNKLHSIEEQMFRVSVAIGNFHAVKYFWNKLSNEAKNTRMTLMIAIACWYSWKVRYPNRCETLKCDEYLPRRTQFFEIACFLIQRVPQSQTDELFTWPMNGIREEWYKTILKRLIPLVFSLNYEKYPDLCSNMVQKTFRYSGNDPTEFKCLHIIHELLEVLHRESGLHGIEIFHCFYEFWALSPTDIDSKVRSFIQWMWLEKKKWNFLSVLDSIINYPGFPKFVQIQSIHSILLRAEIDRMGKPIERNMRPLYRERSNFAYFMLGKPQFYTF